MKARLLQRDVSKFNPKAPPPMTAAKRNMLDQSRPAGVRWLRDQSDCEAEHEHRQLPLKTELAELKPAIACLLKIRSERH